MVVCSHNSFVCRLRNCKCSDILFHITDDLLFESLICFPDITPSLVVQNIHLCSYTFQALFPVHVSIYSFHVLTTPKT